MIPNNLVLNLIINGLPSIFREAAGKEPVKVVLNLIINGLPSIFTAINTIREAAGKF